MLLQLDKNNGELQEIHASNTKKLCEYHHKFNKFLQKESSLEKRKAGGFLIGQMVQIEQERNNYSHNLEELHLKIESLVFALLKQRADTT